MVAFGLRSLLVMTLALWSWGAVAAEWEYDEQNAGYINMVCAGCHGEYGQGGGGGEYPRIAGLPEAYIAAQLRLFKDQKRVNLPMIPFTKERELPEPDLRDISRYLSGIQLRNQFPPTDTVMDGLERLKQAKQVVQIPRYEGDIDAGKGIYRADCRECHGNDGMGKKDAPQLAGQFSGYLLKQMKEFVAGRRKHEYTEEMFSDLTDEDYANLLAYLSILDD
ncbi:MAG: c-type cytochrome [Rhodospirillales bacterium]|nr:c-type cytochrome [Rhodospirillales bacterium]MCW8969724.1 c-type cytochrome [Rhodospirillales bacterium]MCW9040822.1 c-type cytochrome [Rhodospirillales bacterium]